MDLIENSQKVVSLGVKFVTENGLGSSLLDYLEMIDQITMRVEGT